MVTAMGHGGGLAGCSIRHAVARRRRRMSGRASGAMQRQLWHPQRCPAFGSASQRRRQGSRTTGQQHPSARHPPALPLGAWSVQTPRRRDHRLVEAQARPPRSLRQHPVEPLALEGMHLHARSALPALPLILLPWHRCGVRQERGGLNVHLTDIVYAVYVCRFST